MILSWFEVVESRSWCRLEVVRVVWAWPSAGRETPPIVEEVRMAGLILGR